MKVLLVSVKSEESKGGIAIWTEHYLSGCSEANIGCDVVNTAGIGKNAVFVTAKRNLFNEIIRTGRINRQLKTQLKNTYDIAHLNTCIGIFGAIRDYYLAKKIVRKHVPLVVHFHCDVPYWVTNPIIKHYVKKLLSISSANFVLCENSSRYLKQKFNADSVKVPNFIENSMIADKNAVKTDFSKIFFVGRVSLLKGAKEIFELAKRFPDILFELVGEISDEIAALEKPDNVDEVGMLPHEDVISHMDAADAFLFPSYTEGFSLAIAESMARGLPAIATDVGANADMLEDKGGIIVPVGDIDAMQAAIVKISDAKVREKMSVWNINKVKECYTTEKVMELIKEQYLKLIKE